MITAKFGLIGANSAGKSITFECMLGTRKPDTGMVSILEMNPFLQRKQLFENVGVQFQEANYRDKVTVVKLCKITQALYRRVADSPYDKFEDAYLWYSDEKVNDENI